MIRFITGPDQGQSSLIPSGEAKAASLGNFTPAGVSDGPAQALRGGRFPWSGVRWPITSLPQTV